MLLSFTFCYGNEHARLLLVNKFVVLILHNRLVVILQVLPVTVSKCCLQLSYYIMVCQVKSRCRKVTSPSCHPSWV